MHNDFPKKVISFAKKRYASLKRDLPAIAFPLLREAFLDAHNPSMQRFLVYIKLIMVSTNHTLLINKMTMTLF